MMAQEQSVNRVAVVGGYGVVGSGMVSDMLGRPDWATITVGRSVAPDTLLDGRATPPHVRLDLLRPVEDAETLEALSGVTDMVYCAFTEQENMAATVAPNRIMLENALAGLRRAGAPLRHVVLIGGGKSYGEHLGPYKTPAKERDARFLGPIFYNDQEDLLCDCAGRDSFTWTVLRPDAVLGPGIGSPMNMLMAIAVFASVCRELRIPLRFPGAEGAWRALHQATDVGVLAEAVHWALTHDAAQNEIFNVTNGDHFRWEQIWPEIAAVFDIEIAPRQPMSLTEQMKDKSELWESIVQRHGLRDIPLERLVSRPFADGWFGMEYDMVQSTIKIRKAGFNGCMDTHDGMIAALTKLRENRIIP